MKQPYYRTVYQIDNLGSASTYIVEKQFWCYILWKNERSRMLKEIAGACRTGASGCGGGSSEPVDKRNKDEKKCDFCERTFKQVRLHF
jgi:hypothetical protein